MSFKKGDTITMKPGAKSYAGFDAGGKTGEVEDAERWNYAPYTLSVKFPNEYGTKLMRPQDVVPPQGEYTPTQITNALAKVKKAGGYCEDFDRAVQEAKDLNLLDRLKSVATARGREDIYAELLKELEPTPEYKDGDRVHYQMYDTDYVLALESGEWVYEAPTAGTRLTPININTMFDDPERKIVNTVNLKPGRVYEKVEIPVVGQWITATYADNHTDTFEVTLNATQNTSSSWKATWLRKNPRDSSTWDFIYTSEGRSAGSDKTREVVSWVPATKPWAVGDLVPANTIVGRQWIGSLLNDSLNVLGLGSSNSSGYDRKIIAFVDDI